MKKLITLVVLASAASFSAFANEPRTCESADAHNLARLAKKSVSKFASAIAGVTSIGITDCDPRYVGKRLGLRMPQNELPEVCGVTIGFNTVEDELSFVNSMKVLGNKIRVYDEIGALKEVPVCGRVTGTVRPQ